MVVVVAGFDVAMKEEYYLFEVFFFFQAEDGIRVAQESRGLGDVYKRQTLMTTTTNTTTERQNPGEEVITTTTDTVRSPRGW